MRRIILMLGLAWSLSFPAAAHQCVLEGSTSEAIQSYNACKLDLATGQSGHGGDDQSAELARLPREDVEVLVCTYFTVQYEVLINESPQVCTEPGT